MKALRIEEYGSVEVLEWKDAPEPTPSPHQVLIRVDAAGVNYADIMRRQGNYPRPRPAGYPGGWRPPASSPSWVPQ